jgi:UDP-2,3-diacylglucosamine hydrolase
MTLTLPPESQLQAPATWRTVDLISDLHLQASEASTFNVWQRYMSHTPADAVLILGDLFEVWVGDDAVAQSPFLQSCAKVLKSTGQRLYLGLMHGNRDFLIGESFVQDCHAHLLSDPTLLRFGRASWLLSHGDALCLADVSYQQFRNQVRTPEWRSEFLNQPLAKRQAVARGIRNESEARKRAGTDTGSREMYADADTTLSQSWLKKACAPILIHGHTHQPADHVLIGDVAGQPHARWVLSDWDAGAQPARAQVLRLFENGQHQRIDVV